MTEKEIRKYILDLSFELQNNFENPRFSTVGLILDHFNAIPNHMLYRYRPCNNDEFNVLEKNSVYLSKASGFKDKLDSAIFYDYDGLTKRQKQKLVKSYTLANYSKGYLEYELGKRKYMPSPQIVRKFINNCYDKNFYLIKRKFIKFVNKNFSTDRDKWGARLLELDAIFTEKGKGDKLRDWLISKEKNDAVDITKQRQEKTFVCSFTELPFNLSMWENYADNYSGFCVGYKLEGVYTRHLQSPLLRVCLLHILPVIYTEKTNLQSGYAFSLEQDRMMYEKALGKDNNDFDAIWYYSTVLSMLYKKKFYEWEKEWRIVLSNLQNNIVFFPYAVKLFLGKNIEKDNKDKLIQIARKNNLSVYQQCLNESKGTYEYKLIIPRIEEEKGKEKTVFIAGNPYI